MFMVMFVNRYYLCIDLKTFYASVECIERGLDPFETDLVVADPKRGSGTICLAISPKMKKRGISNRCRMFEIPKYIKPIIAKPRMKKYIEYSVKIYSIYLKYIAKDDIHVYSIDEAFLDVTNYLNLYQKTPIEISKMIAEDIFNTTGITATVGIGTNMYLAKIALDIISKHNRSNIGYLDENKYKKELWHHTPLTDFWQIGIGTLKRLNKLHLKDMSDIALCDENILYKEFGINARILIDHAKGIETVTIKEIKNYQPKTKSFSNSQILLSDYDYKNARTVLIEMIDNAVLNLVEQKLYTNKISFYIGYSNDVIPRLKVCKTLKQSTNSYSNLLKIILSEYDYQINEKIPIRRVSIYFGNLKTRKFEQLDLFGSNEITEQEQIIGHTINDIKNRFGKDAILRAISYDEGATQRMRNQLIGGHNAE